MTNFWNASSQTQNRTPDLLLWSQELYHNMTAAPSASYKDMGMYMYLTIKYLWLWGSSGCWVVELQACGANCPEFKWRSHYYNFWDFVSPAGKLRYGWNNMTSRKQPKQHISYYNSINLIYWLLEILNNARMSNSHTLVNIFATA